MAAAEYPAWYQARVQGEAALDPSEVHGLLAETGMYRCLPPSSLQWLRQGSRRSGQPD